MGKETEINTELNEIKELENKIRKHKPRQKKTMKTPATSTAFYLTYILLATAEVTMTYNPAAGLTLHATTLLALITGIATLNKPQTEHTKENRNTTMLLKALMLLPLTRIFAYTMPLIFFRKIYWFLLISIPLLIAVATLTKNLGLTPRDIGLRKGKLRTQVPVALTGILLGYIEYMILKPKPLLDTPPTPENIIIPALTILIFTGLTEELIYRGIIQTISTKIFTPVNGIIYTAIIFTTMHTGFNSITHMTFILTAALYYGTVYYKTKSLTGIILAHGLNNIILLLIAPYTL